MKLFTYCFHGKQSSNNNMQNMLKLICCCCLLCISMNYVKHFMLDIGIVHKTSVL